MFPIDKYKFYTDDPKNPRKVYAVSTYAGKTVRAVAKCDTRDTFSQEKGRELAAARCNEKVAKKRMQRAIRKYNEAYALLDSINKRVSELEGYLYDACRSYDDAKEDVQKLLWEM